jgi:uncharacterized protein YggE
VTPETSILTSALRRRTPKRQQVAGVTHLQRSPASSMIAAVRGSRAGSEVVVVIGRARRAVEADVADLAFTVVEVDSDQRAAFGRCGERVNALVPRLRASAGAQSAVSTGHLVLDRHYAEDDGRERTDGYAASCPITVECAPEAAASVLAEAIAAGVERVRGPGYGVRDRSAVTDELLGAAVRDARRKALRLSEAAERQLGQATTVEEVHEFDDGAAFFEGSVMAASATGGGVELQPSRLELTSTVRVTFALTPAG